MRNLGIAIFDGEGKVSQWRENASYTLLWKFEQADKLQRDGKESIVKNSYTPSGDQSIGEQEMKIRRVHW